MSNSELQSPSIRSLGNVRRREVSNAPRAWVREEAPEGGGTLPLVVTPAADGLDLAAWARDNQGFIEERLRRHGGILFRGFDLKDVERFERFVAAASSRMMDYEDRTSPRSKVSGNVYTSTDHPDDQKILLHNENSYSYTWPKKIFFFCVVPAAEGGETPIADCRKVLRHLSPELVERFRQTGITYVRNFGDGFGLPWQAVFQTEDPSQVEDFCRRNAIEFEWKDGGRLRTRQVRPAVISHPATGEPVWFNQALLFHVSALEPEVREALLASFAEADLPSHVCHGDGTPIEPAALQQIADAYDRETVSFPWRKGDLLMLDNVLVAHGRSPFVRPRKIVVGMSEPMTLEEV